ncbi:MAG: hypothetical protein DCC57_05445 [Chloroflexi bacterium]|nr:MAG: hypothetical protein DCC57_05445 [Chloroflexota bacterium]
MVRVSQGAADRATAWRVRDALAAHPLLGGSTAQISIQANFEAVTLDGWALDDQVQQLALRLAVRAAGRYPVHMQLRVRRCTAGGRRANAIQTHQI